MKKVLKSGLILGLMIAAVGAMASESQERAEGVIQKLESQKIRLQKVKRGPSALKLQVKNPLRQNQGLERLSDFHGNFSF